MTVETMKKALQLHALNETAAGLQQTIAGGYVSDLLSDVMGNMNENMVWITMQTHRNVLAVAKLKEAAAIIIVQQKAMDAELLQVAHEEGLCVYNTPLSAFEAAGRLYELLHNK